MNIIYQGDCLEIIRDKIQDKSIDLILTDPPYEFEGRGGGIAKHRDYLKKGMDKIGTNATIDIYTDSFMQLLISKMKTPNMIFFCNKAQILDILEQAKKNNLNFDILVLCKTAPTPLTNNQRLPDKEYAIHLHKNATVKGNYKTKRTFWVASNFKDKSIDHPTVKPLAVVEQMIQNCSNEGDTVLDPYMGSGTTAVACKKLNRDFIGCEINPDYIKIAEKRLQDIQQNTLF